MNCSDYRELISASIDRRLGAAETGDLASHLAGCPDCRRAHEETEAGDALLRRIERIDLPAGFEDRVLALASVERPARKRGSFLAPLFTCAAAAAMLVVLGIALFTPAAPQTRPVAELKRDFQDHLNRVDTVVKTAQMLDEEKGLEEIRAAIQMFDIPERTAYLRQQRKPELEQYLQATDVFLALVERGDASEVRMQARAALALLAAHDVQTQLSVQVAAPKPTELDVKGVPEKYVFALRGRLHYLNGDYAAAKYDLDRAVETRATLLTRGDACRAVGNLEDAIADYTAAIQVSGDAWTYSYVANSFRNLQGRSVWINDQEIKVDANSGEVLVEALKGGHLTCFWATDSEPREFVIVGPEDNPRVKAATKNARSVATTRGVSRVSGMVDAEVMKVRMLREMVERSRHVDK